VVSSIVVAGPVNMIVVTANWEIGDGSLWPGPAASMMGRFAAEVTRAAVRAGWRADGRYDPVPRVDVVFAGDTFDWLASREWLGRSRPWQRGAAAVATRERVIAGTLRAGRGIVRGMLTLVRRGVLVPRGDRHGRPVPTAPVRIPVGLSLLEGNLDAGLSREGARTSAARYGIGVGAAWQSGSVRVVHGDRTDPLWITQAAPGTGPSLGESLRVDLVGRFIASDPIDVIDADARRSLFAVLRAADPLGLADGLAAWLATGRDIAATGRVRDAWQRSVAAWHRAARGSGLTGAGPWSDVPFDAVDALADRLSAIDRNVGSSRPRTGSADPLADLFGDSPPIAASCPAGGILVLGHAPVDAPLPRRPGRIVRLGARRGIEQTGDGQRRGVREISLAPSGPPFPVTAVITDRGGTALAVSSLGDPVAEWSDGERGGGSPPPFESGAWIVEAA
jgi:hypothetical protein